MLYKYAIANLAISIASALGCLALAAGPFVGYLSTTKYNYFLSGAFVATFFFYHWKDMGKSYAAFCETRRNRNDH